MLYVEKISDIRKEAIDYITSVVKKRGTNYELVDPALYEDGFEDGMYDVPRGFTVNKYGYMDVHPIVVIDIDDNDKLTFKGIGGLMDFGETDEDNDYSVDNLETYVICQIADLVESLEN